MVDGEAADAEPEEGDTLSQFAPEAVLACAVQLSVPPPELLIRSVCAGAAAPATASKLKPDGSTNSLGGSAAETLKVTAIATNEGAAAGTRTSMLPW